MLESGWAYLSHLKLNKIIRMTQLQKQMPPDHLEKR
jgi:hypothetical protein